MIRTRIVELPSDYYLFKFNNRNTRKRCERTYFAHFSSVAMADFEQVNIW